MLSENGPEDDVEESKRLSRNQLAVVEHGRDPQLELEAGPEQAINIRTWAQRILDDCMTVAEVMDKVSGSGHHVSAVTAQVEKVKDANQTPSARSLNQMSEEKVPFFRFVMNQAIDTKKSFAQAPLEEHVRLQMEKDAQASLQRQAEAEAEDTRAFSEFLSEYLALPE